MHCFIPARSIFGGGELELVEDRAQAVLDIAEKHEFQVWRAVATCLHGAALAGIDRAEEGLAQVRWGMHLYQGLKTPPIFWPLLLYLKAGACAQAGKPEDGSSLLDGAMEIASHFSGRTTLPEFLRLKGDLLISISPENAAEAESWFQHVLEVAQELEARMLELRVAISMSRLWQAQGKAEQGRCVFPSYGNVCVIRNFVSATISNTQTIRSTVYQTRDRQSLSTA